MAEQSTSTGRRKNKALKEDDFARKNIAPNDGMSKSSFFEAINTRGFSRGMKSGRSELDGIRGIIRTENMPA
jgi:hypothetical protein